MFSPERFPRIANSTVASGTWHGPEITASATPHTKGAWVSLIASTGFDAYMCGVIVSENQTTGDTATLVDIGSDPAAGTAYTVDIPNILAAGAAINTAVGGPGITWFPVSIAKGSQVAARSQAVVVSDVCRVGVILLGGKNRSNPFPHRSVIQDYGTNTATSNGTPLADAAIDTKGAWTQLGADTTRRHSGLVVRVANSAAVPAGGARALVDIGMDPAGGTTYGVVIPDVPCWIGGGESAVAIGNVAGLLAVDIPSGASIAARSAMSVANTNNDLLVAVYAF